MNSSIFKSRRKCWEGCYVPTNDERLAVWALRYYGTGHHKNKQDVNNPDETSMIKESTTTDLELLNHIDNRSRTD